MPISTGIEIGCPEKPSNSKPPSGARNSEPMLTSGETKRWYSSTSTENTSNTPEITAAIMLLTISCCH